MEWWTQYRTNLRSGIVPLGMLLISPLGLLGYMYFLEKTTGDPLIFLHTVEMFGDQRSSHLILLPQVFYRYVFKVLPNLTLYWPILFTTLLEIVVGVLFLVFLIVGFWRMRASYWVFLAGTYIIPTLSGSFSSMPRYVLIIFPAFVLFAYGVEKAPRLVKYLVFFFSYLGLLVASSLFFSGYWVS
jgi:hypothetical protein